MNFAIDANAVYITPSGRRCKWLPLGGPHRVWVAYAHFVYLNETRALSDGFTLAAANYGILRKEGSHAPAR